jgi:putative ABC transport system permease protein
MLIPRLALRSLRSRLLTTSLTVASIALSVTLLVGIEHVRAGVRESFAGTIRGVDLIVGARGGTLQVLLSAVFGIGSPSGAVSYATFQRWQGHPAVKWAVPYSLGDSHRGYRVIGTTPEFFERYRFRQDGRIRFVQGRVARGDEEVVIGSEVAERLGYRLGTPVVVVHGLRDIGTSDHEAHPFKVVGILGRTFTPIDRSIYVTLAGIEAMHEEEPGAGAPNSAPPAMPGAEPAAAAPTATSATPTKGARQPRPAGTPTVMPGASPPPGTPMVMPGAEPPAGTPMVMPGASPPPGTPMVMPGAEPPAGTPMVMPGAEPPPKAAVASSAPAPAPKAKTTATIAADSAGFVVPPDFPVSAFFVGTKNRFEALMLQREMNTDLTEPLTAVIPGVALGELWQNIGSAEVGLRVVAIFAVAIGLTGMLVALYSSLEARRREMAIFRAIGAGPRTIVTLLVLESGLLSLLGCVIGVAFVYAGLLLGQQPIEQRFGLHLAIRPLGTTEWIYIGVVLVAGILIGFVPALKAYRTSLVDGLSPRT